MKGLKITVEQTITSLITITATAPGFNETHYTSALTLMFFSKSEKHLRRDIEKIKDGIKGRYKVCTESSEEK
jgi:hypothetical protein